MRLRWQFFDANPVNGMILIRECISEAALENDQDKGQLLSEGGHGSC